MRSRNSTGAICALPIVLAALIVLLAGCGGTSTTGTSGVTANTTTSGQTAPAGTAGTAPTDESLAAKQARGRAVFDQKCTGCHQVNGQGAPGPGPDLTHESAPPPPGSNLLPYPQFYSQWLDNPKFYLPDAKMPIVPLTPQEKSDVIEYLLTLT